MLKFILSAVALVGIVLFFGTMGTSDYELGFQVKNLTPVMVVGLLAALAGLGGILALWVRKRLKQIDAENREIQNDPFRVRPKALDRQW